MAVQGLASRANAVIVHPVYQLYAPVWRQLVDVYDGSGGFLDGTYLVAHPREWKDHTAAKPRQPTKKLLARRALARYENIAATIIDQKRSALFRGEITRTVGDEDPKTKTTLHPLETWWQDVDGAGTHITDWMADAFTYAALFGHIVHYMDLPEGDQPETQADAGSPFLRAYTPLDVPDWRLDDRGRFTAIRLLEAEIEQDPTKPHTAGDTYRERLVTRDAWTVYSRGRAGAVEETTGDHTFGVVPVVVQYATRKRLAQLIGQSVLGDPKLHIDLYNLTSEIRELLRNQTFGILTVTLGTGDNATAIETAQKMLGDAKGVENVMFTPAGAEYIQPESTNVTVYQDERQQLMRAIYRLAAIPYEADSKDAEAEGSMKLKREDMNQVLSAYADHCEQTEYEIAKLWFRARYGPEQWERAYEDAQVVIRYPDTFDVTPFAEMLEQAQAATTLEMGPTFMAELKKRLLPKFLPDAPESVVAAIEKELEALVKEIAEADSERRQLELQAMAAPDEGVAA